MAELTAWMQSNWYGLGHLLVEIAFLAAGVWFARGFLRTIRSLHEQVGALLKLSILGTPEVRHPDVVSSKRSPADVSPFWLMPSGTLASNLPEPSETGTTRVIGSWHHLVEWLKTPMSTGETLQSSRVIKWLQTPIRS